MSSWWDALTNRNKTSPQNTQNMQNNQAYNQQQMNQQLGNIQNYQQGNPEYGNQYGYANQYQGANVNSNQQYGQYGQYGQSYSNTNVANTNSQIKNLYPNLPDWTQPFNQYDYGSKIKYAQSQQMLNPPTLNNANTYSNANTNTNTYANVNTNANTYSNTTYSNTNTFQNTTANIYTNTPKNNQNPPANYNANATFNPIDALTVHALGWQLDQSTTQQLGQTKFVQQIGQQTLRNHKAFLGQANNHSNVNPNEIWGMAAKGIQGQNVNYNPQNFNIYNYLGNNVNNIISQTAPSFQLNPTFLLGQTINNDNFPMPFVKYKIIPQLDEKKSLDVTSVNDEKKNFKKNNLIIWDYHGGPNQHFYINKENDGKCFIINIARGFAVKIPNVVSADKKEVNVIAGPRLNGLNEKWQLRQLKGGSFQIISAKSGKALDLFYERCENGTSVIEWEPKDTKNQLWRIVPA